MNVTYRCRGCERATRADITADAQRVACTHCGQQIAVAAGAYDGQQLRRCVVCPGKDLFVRKDFPQRLGVTIVVIGFAASCVTWYYYLTYWTFGVLAATVVADLVLYLATGSCIACYGCGAEYRDVGRREGFEPFNLETHERYRQQAVRLKEASRPRHEASREG